jgi:hypothetical protein
MLIDWAGFNFYNVKEREGHVPSNCSWSAVTYFTGGVSLSCAPNTTYFYRKYCFVWSGQNYSEIFFSLRWYKTAGNCTTISKIIQWMKGSTVLGGLALETTGKLAFYTGNFASKVGETSGAPSDLTWHHLEFRVKIADDPDGVLNLLVNGSEDSISFTGDTKPGADTGIDQTQLGNAYDVVTLYWDDVVFHDTSGSRNNSWVGPARVWRLRPTSDSTPLEWTTSGANHYGVLDEDTPADADYIRSTANDDEDELGLTDLVDVGTIKAVVAHAWAYRGSEVDPQKLKLGLDLGGTDYDSAALTLGTSLGIVEKLWEEHPGTSNLFTEADVDAAKLRLVSASGT